MKNGQSQAEQKNGPLELAWLGPITITYHYLESLVKNTYVHSDNNKKIPIRNFHLTACSPVVYQAIFKGRHISEHSCCPEQPAPCET